MPTDKPGFFEETQHLAESYVSNRIRLLKLQTAEKSSRVVTLIFAGLVIGILSFFILLFLSIMVALYLSEKWHNPLYGFGLVALFYVLLLLLVLVVRKSLNNYFFSKVISILFESNNNDDEKQ